MGSRKQEPTMSDLVMTSWQEASRVSRIAWGEATKVGNTLNRIRIIAMSPPAPIDDGWEVVDKEDFEPPANMRPRSKPQIAEPPRGAQPPGNSTVSKFHNNMTEEEVVSRYRQTERELRHAIKQGNAESERRLRNELSQRRHDVWKVEKASWANTPTHGGQPTTSATKLPVFKDSQPRIETGTKNKMEESPYSDQTFEKTEPAPESLDTKAHSRTTYHELRKKARQTAAKAPSASTFVLEQAAKVSDGAPSCGQASQAPGENQETAETDREGMGEESTMEEMTWSQPKGESP
ncbi:hypothetical protein B0T16DRAFT_221573 [Cercophora newfieldiana]|uniref:Uncharacterized protein n=1 Tax=Cercophora newfieldiana TaxID=92897 RepID=A0AA39XX39_9PEZI|nr:hypothetical protein B0T16DRAFT_221573 [Cercophora newfieldiana]